MLAFILRRCSQSVFVIIMVSLLVFLALYAVGSPVDMLLPPDADREDIENYSRALGLNEPLWKQYFIFVQNILQGDLGYSFYHEVPALGLVLERMPATLELAATALILAILMGVPLGIYAGLHPNSRFSKAIMGLSIFGVSIPNFWQGVMLILIFSVNLHWLPSTGRGEVGVFLGIHSSIFTLDGISHLILPSLNLSIFYAALLLRLTRANVMEVALLDYIKFAHAKGLSRSRVIFIHILKNVGIPLITVIGLEFGSLIAFSVITETIFSWPGMGKLIIDSIFLLDRPVIVSYLIIVAVLFSLINLVVDLLYSVVDPRISVGTAE